MKLQRGGTETPVFPAQTSLLAPAPRSLWSAGKGTAILGICLLFPHLNWFETFVFRFEIFLDG